MKLLLQCGKTFLLIHKAEQSAKNILSLTL